MVDKAVRSSVEAFLRKVRENGVSVRYGVIFGSHATGRSSDLSDIDLLVVSPQFDERRERKDINMLWHLAARTDNRIEPIPCGEKQWLEDDSSAIIEIARREGEVVEV
ncbi:MAG: nucleotidyltransferase domain-containing protein [Nitrospirae bacterium]|nr:nucleotidyltransferase domain-containing protein [Nitrospirota bacterium]